MNGGALIEKVKVIREGNGSIDVIIPSAALWECVECFSENRLQAFFSFAAPNFVAHMSTVSPQRLQDTLRGWRTSGDDQRRLSDA